MISGIVIALLWVVMILCLLALSLGASCRLFRAASKTKKEANAYAKKKKEEADKSLNKYISLTPSELDKQLAYIFASQLELSSLVDIAEADHEAVPKLYAKTLNRVLAYIGPESTSAIDYYYGNGYIIRWVETRFKLLENRGVIAKVVQKDIYAESIVSELKIE